MTTEASSEHRYKPQDCPSFNGCSAPLCPLDDSLPHAVWYIDEPICGSRLYRMPWIRAQRRIARRGKDTTGYFNVKMLGTVHAVYSSIKGVDPNHDATPENWIKARGGI